MMYLLPIILWSAASMGVYGGILVPLMTRAMDNSGDLYPGLPDDESKQNQKALFAMTLLGAGEILGGGMVGMIRDKVGNRTAYIS